MTSPDRDDDVRDLLRRQADSIRPLGTYADVERKLSAEAGRRRQTGRTVILGLAAAIALLVGVVAVSLARAPDEEKVVVTATDPTPPTPASTTALTPTPSTAVTTAEAPPTTAVVEPEATTTVPATTAPPTTTTTVPPTTTPPPPPIRPVTAGSRVTLWGIGSVSVPTTVAELEALTGSDLVLRGEPAPGSTCAVGDLAGGPSGVSFLLDGDRVTRVDVGPEGTNLTTSGIGVGATEAEVLAAYADATVAPGKYAGNTITVTSPSAPDHLLLFETDGSRVVAFRSGLTEAVQLVELCG